MEDRITELTTHKNKGNTLYLCMRDQRINYNHGLIHAYSISYNYKSELYIGIPYTKIKMNDEQYKFMWEGLCEMYIECLKYNLYMISITDISKCIKNHNIKNLVIDYSPLREYTSYINEIKEICKKSKLYFVQVDSHNIVPHTLLSIYKRTSSSCKLTLYKHFDKYFNENIKENEVHKYNDKRKVKELKFDVPEYSKSKYYKGGYKAGMEVYETFLRHKFSDYDKFRNNPDEDVLSNLSPYLHFGQLSSLELVRIAYERYYDTDNDNLDTFLNEIFVWKETAEHFCYHEVNYDNIKGALQWAQDSLYDHAKDKRIHLYSKEELEKGLTEDRLWNAAQKELIYSNKMHGYARMYWAKTLVKWTKTPEEALSLCIELNDKYMIDGNDPNGYTGIMWSICGSMDRGYKDRPITGKIRPMNEFKTKTYTDLWNDEEERRKHLKSIEVHR